MLHQSFLCSLMFLCVLFSQVVAEEERKETDEHVGVIRTVTLYRDRALVTREIEVPAGKELHTINVPDLPESVFPDSVYADSHEGTVVRAVRVSPRVTADSDRAEVRKLEKEIHELKQQRAEVQQALDGIAQDLETLRKMVGLSADFGKSDLNRGVLNAETLVELTDFSMTRRRELAAEQFQQQQKLNALDEQLGKLDLERNLDSQGDQSVSYQAKLFVETADGAAATVRLSYQVGNCGWSPQYSVRGQIDNPSVLLRYNALVHQMSGEDWSEIELTLSTASPSVSAARPVLTPLRVVSANPEDIVHDLGQAVEQDNPFDRPSRDRQSAVLSGMLQTLRAKQQFVEAELDEASSSDLPDERDAALNSLAGQMQQIELQAEANSWRTLAPDVTDDVASQVYSLEGPISLDTRRERQLVRIMESEYDGEMYHVATPLLSTFAYREVQFTNTRPIGLLGGPATIYLDGRFVGRTQIPSTASGQRLTIGFGADQQVRTRRELLDKTDEVQGGNRQLEFVYRLVLSNFKDQPVTVRLIDRMPNTRQTQQLSVKLAEPTLPLSDDGLYQRIDRPTGVLRWDLELPAGRHGSEAFDVQYRFTMEFDRNQIPTTKDALTEVQSEHDNVNLPSGMGGMGGFGGGMN